jgi:N-acetylglucosaminyl-diphospho-decaprenol L-rhamnosyltransferase
MMQSKSPLQKNVPLEQVSIIIPSYNGIRVLEQCMTILGEIAHQSQVIVVDGGSSDGSVELVQEKFAWATLVQVPNFGWAHATNRGFELASGQYLVTLNSDVFLTAQALEAMVLRLLENPQIGAVQPYLLNGDGSRQLVFGMLYPPHWTKMDKPVFAPVLSGACLMTRRDVLEHIGGFDENFFFYNEEFDWCWRARKAGYKMELRPERVVHLEGGSTPKNPNFQLEAQRGAMYLLHKHYHPIAFEISRLGGQLICWLGIDLDPRKEYRQAWIAMERIARERRYLETPFQLSGRGEVKFERKPNASPESSRAACPN